MKERPINMKAWEVQAIRNGRKTQFRRVVKNTGLYAVDAAIHGPEVAARELIALATRCPYGAPGDRLWVRETWQPYDRMTAWEDKDGMLVDDCDYALCFRADDDDTAVKWVTAPKGGRAWPTTDNKWHPSIHMPRWASRFDLELVSRRVERLNEITPDDCRAEGQPAGNNDIGVRYGFGQQWQSDNGPGSWGDQWVWVVEFRQV